MRSVLWNLCSWQLSVETFQKALWYPWKGQNAADVLQLPCPGKQGAGKVWHRDVGAPGMLWSWIMWYFYAYAVCVQVCGRCSMAQGISMSMKSSTDPPISKQKQVALHICCSFECRATMQAISKPLSPGDKGIDLIMVQMKILHIWISTKYRSSRCPLMSAAVFFVAHISGPQLAGLGVFANYCPSFVLRLKKFFPIATSSARIHYWDLVKTYTLINCGSCMNMQRFIISGNWEAVRRRKWLVCFSVTVTVQSLLSHCT